MIGPFAAAAVFALAGAQPRALVVTETAGFQHPSIPAARAALVRLGERSPGFDVVPVASSSSLTAAALGGARAVVFLSTTEELRMGTSGKRLLGWIADGGAFVGLHAATNTFANEPEFARMLGAQFEAHPFVGRGRVVLSEPEPPGDARPAVRRSSSTTSSTSSRPARAGARTSSPGARRSATSRLSGGGERAAGVSSTARSGTRTPPGAIRMSCAWWKVGCAGRWERAAQTASAPTSPGTIGFAFSREGHG